MRWTIYKSSGLATFVSIVGAFVCYAGILGLFAKEFLTAVICIVIGLAIQMGADSIAKNATFKKWKNEVVSKGYAQLIAQGDYSVAVQLYNQNPGEKTMQYFKTLNPQAASRIEASLQGSAIQKAAPVETRAAQPAPEPPKSVQTAAAANKSQPSQTERCAGCGAEPVPNSKFCAKCGAKVGREKMCVRCGAKLAEGAKFCGKCGQQIP